MWLLCSEAENADRGPKAPRAGPAQVPRHRPRRQSQQTRRDEEAPPPPACPGLHVTCRPRKQSLHPRASSATYSPRLQAPRSRTRTCWAAHPLLEATGTDDHEPDAKTSRIYCCGTTGPAVPRQRLHGERVRCPCPCRGPPPRSGVHALPPGPTRTTQAQPPPEGPPLGGAAQRSRAVTPAFGGREHLAACTWDEGGFAQVSELFSPWN